jgi:hypothetical protein
MSATNFPQFRDCRSRDVEKPRGISKIEEENASPLITHEV